MYEFRRKAVRALLLVRGLSPISTAKHPLAREFYMLFRYEPEAKVFNTATAVKELQKIYEDLMREAEGVVASLNARLPAEADRLKTAEEFDSQWKTDGAKSLNPVYDEGGEINHLLSVLSWLVPASAIVAVAERHVMVPNGKYHMCYAWFRSKITK